MANTSLSNASEKMIDTELRRIWSLGANVIVAWKAIPFGIIVIYLPSYDLPRVAKLHDDLLDANRHIDSSERLSSLLEAGCLSKEIKMDERVGSDENSINAVNRLIRAYTVAHVPCSVPVRHGQLLALLALRADHADQRAFTLHQSRKLALSARKHAGGHLHDHDGRRILHVESPGRSDG